MPLRAQYLIPVVLLLAASCIEPLKPASERTGFASATTMDLGGGNYGATFSAAFYRYDGLSLILGEPETCQTYFYSPTGTPTGTLPAISAGDRLLTQLSGREDTLVQTTSLGTLSYSLGAHLGSVPFTPGDTLTLQIPGALNGFPEAMLKVRTVEPFTHSAIDTSSIDPIPLTWTTPSVAGSLVIFYMRYSSTSTSEEPDTELRCAFTDDGVGEVPQPYAAAWTFAPEASRSYLAQRVRYTTLALDEKTRVTLLSFFDVPTPTP